MTRASAPRDHLERGELMKRLHWTGPAALIAVGVILAFSMVATASLAQAAAQGASYTFALSDAELDVERPWTIDRGAIVDSDDANVVKLDGESDNVLLGYFPASTSIAEADAAMVGPYADHFDAVQVVESGTTGAYSYGLNLVTIDGQEFGVFSLYTSKGASGFAEASVYIAPVDGFGDGLDAAKQHITIDGSPIFGGVQGDGVQRVLSNAAGTVPAGEVSGPPLPPSGGATPAASPEATPAG
jgi:hypothetical protein